MIRGGFGAQWADLGRAGVRAAAGSVVSDGSGPGDTSGRVLPYHGRDERPVGARPSVRGKFLWADDEKSAAGAGDDHGRRPRATGTFLSVGPDKPLARGVTYGALAPNPDGDSYPDPRTVDADFARMAAAGIDAITTYTTPPGWLRDLASAHGLFVLAGIAWEQHVAFLDRGVRRK
jgi:hypothetical protein